MTRDQENATYDLITLGSAGAVIFSVVSSLMPVLLFGTTASLANHFPEAALATALYLPLHLRHVRHGLRGVCPRGLIWSISAMAIIIVGASPLLGWFWFYAYSALVASILVTTQLRWSFPIFVFLVAGVVCWGVAVDVGVPGAAFGAVAVIDRSAVVFVLVWLVGALRRVRVAHQALAEDALSRERERIDGDLEDTVAAALKSILSDADQAAVASALGHDEAAVFLNSLMAGSRGALTEARKLINHYERASPRVEIERAASLLRAAGIDAHVELPDTDLPMSQDRGFSASLQAAVRDLLSMEGPGEVILELTYANGTSELVTRFAPTGESLA